MRNKIVRLLKALSNESVKRLPYIIFIGLILIFVQFIHLNNQTAQGVRIAKGNSIDSKSLLKQVAALSKDNKRLTQQNIDIAEQNAAHLDCVAKLFAQYTRSPRPISDTDLANCFIREAGQKPSTGAQSAAQPSLSNRSVPSSSPKNMPKVTTPLRDKSHPTKPVTPQPHRNVAQRAILKVSNFIRSVF